MAFTGPLTPEQQAQIDAYYASHPNADAPVINAAPTVFEPDPIRPVGAQLSQVGDPQNGPMPIFATPPPPAAPGGLTAADVGKPPEASLSTSDFVAGAPVPTATVNTGGAAPADDREFAAFRKLQDTRTSSAKPAATGKPNPDPFGVKGAQSKYLGTFDTERTAQQAIGAAEAARAGTVAGLRGNLAQQQQEDAVAQANERDLAQRGFDAHMAEAQQQLDEVRNQKIDPNRLMKTDGMGLMAIIGGLFGGLYMGLNKLDHNPFLDDLNKKIDRDIAAQEKDIDNAHRDVGDRMNLLREQRATFKDNELAKLQTRQLMYEATRNSIEAEAAKYDQPIVAARAQQAISVLDREQAKTDLSIKEAAQRTALAQAAAQSARDRAMQLEQRKQFSETYDKNIAAGMSPAQAESEAHRMITNLYNGGAGQRPADASQVSDPVSAVPKDQRTEAVKELREHSDRENGKKALDKAYADYFKSDVSDQSKRNALKAAVRGIIKPHMKGANSDADLEQLIEPLVPAGGVTTESAQRSKLASAKALLDAEGTTPILDRHAPGWRGPAPVQKFDLKGKPIP